MYSQPPRRKRATTTTIIIIICRLLAKNYSKSPSLFCSKYNFVPSMVKLQIYTCIKQINCLFKALPPNTVLPSKVIKENFNKTIRSNLKFWHEAIHPMHWAVFRWSQKNITKFCRQTESLWRMRN